MNRTFVLLIIFAIIIAGGILFYSQKSDSGKKEPVIRTGIYGPSLERLNQLRDLELSTQVLQDPFFRSLNYPKEVSSILEAPTTTPRNNPFIPF